jgi:hypothetical protein
MKTNPKGLMGDEKNTNYGTPPGFFYINQIIIPITDGTAPRFIT